MILPLERSVESDSGRGEAVRVTRVGIEALRFDEGVTM